MEDKLKYVPIMFQKLKQYNVESVDTRFVKVKIWLMHLGENFNGSVFSKEVVEEAIPTLANTPILCFIEENSKGDLDFSDHRMVLVKEENEIKTRYLGQAIGVIPVDNKASFESRLCDDGIEREFLVVEGLVWTKWDDPLDILSNNLIKSQSMEIHDDYEGEFKNNLFCFSKISFFGACILGDDVSPAMINSTVEVEFTQNKVFETIQNKFEQFKQYKEHEEGGNKVDKQDILNKFSYLKGEEFDSIVSNIELTNEELESKLFTLSNNQIERAVRDELNTQKIIKSYYDGEAYETNKYYAEDIIQTESMVIVEDNSSYGKFYGIPYTMSGDLAVLQYDKSVRYTRGDWRTFNEGVDSEVINPMFSDFEKELGIKFESLKESFKPLETEEYKELNAKFELLNKEKDELLSFKNEVLTIQRDNDIAEVFANFDELEGFEGFSELKENSKSMELNDLEINLYALLGKKNFSAKQPSKKKDTIVKVNANFKREEDKLELSEAEKRYGVGIINYIK